MKTYQLVLPPTAPGLPSRHQFTRDASLLASVATGCVILVIDMTDEAFSALKTEQIFS